MLRQSVEFEDRHVSQKVDVCQPWNVGHHRTAADIEKNALGVQDLIPDPQRVRIGELGMTTNDGAVVHAVKPVFDTFAVAQHDGVFAGLDLRHVHADRSGVDPVFGTAARKMRGLCTGHQCLGRDASGVDAGAADQLALHHGNGVTGRGQPACQRGPGLAGAHDDRVEALCHRAAATAASANPPPTVTASSNNATGRSRPTDPARRARAW